MVGVVLDPLTEVTSPAHPHDPLSFRKHVEARHLRNARAIVGTDRRGSAQSIDHAVDYVGRLHGASLFEVDGISGALMSDGSHPTRDPFRRLADGARIEAPWPPPSMLGCSGVLENVLVVGP